MVAKTSFIASALRRFLEDTSFYDLMEVFRSVGQNLLFPLVMSILTIISLTKIGSALKRRISPPPPHVLHHEAKLLYRKGYRKAALQQWKLLTDYAPAYLSRAAHFIYVDGRVQEGLDVLQEARSHKVPRMPKRRREALQMDAEAILSGNGHMVDMNAPVAKQEYLGIGTSG